MIPAASRALLLAAVAALAAGCAQPSRTRASASATAACRSEVDRVYAAQNRRELSMRDQRDTPFAGSYLSGVTTRGLSAQYGRENLNSSCLTNAGAGTSPSALSSDAPGPTFSPAVQ